MSGVRHTRNIYIYTNLSNRLRWFNLFIFLMLFKGTSLSSILYVVSIVAAVATQASVQIPEERLITANLNRNPSPPSKRGDAEAISVQQRVNPQKSLDLIKKQLDNFVENLRSFIKAKEFDFAGFNAQQSLLQSQISEIQKAAIENPFAYKETLTQQIYAEHLFYFMRQSNSVKDVYGLGVEDEKTLIYKAVKLNLRLLSLFSNSGCPNKEMVGFEEVVGRLQRHLISWKRKFGRLGYISQDSRNVFDELTTYAEKTLQVLGRYDS